MAIGSLQGVLSIDNNKVMTNKDRPLDKNLDVDWNQFDEMRKEFPICIDHEKDMVSVKIMTSTVLEGGNGCQLTVFIKMALIIITYLNAKFPCRENAITITKLQEALMWQDQRTKDRKDRKVEGFNKN